MLQGLFWCWAVFGVHLQHPQHQVSAMIRDMSQILFNVTQIANYVLPQKHLWSISLEEIAAGQKVKEDSTETEHICLVAITSPGEDFGGNVARRPALVVYHLVLGGEHSQAEICYPYLVLSIILD
jgi:hypothetical protein